MRTGTPAPSRSVAHFVGVDNEQDSLEMDE
jgi:hypothetical protein